MKNIVMALIAGVIGAIGFSLAHNALYARSFGVIRMDDVLATHMQEIAEQSLSDVEKQVAGKLFAQALDQSVRELRAEGVMLLVSPAVVTSEPDYTESVSSRIREIMGDAEAQ